jgi:serine/threonine protein kinase
LCCFKAKQEDFPEYLTEPLHDELTETDSFDSLITSVSGMSCLTTTPVGANLSPLDIFSDGDPKTMFENLQQISKGSSCLVYKARDGKTNETVAIKVVSELPSMHHSANHRLLNEIAILSSCTHENIVKFYGSWIVDFSIWIVMEHMDDKLSSLRKRRPFKESEIATIIRQILKGLEYMHDKHLIHRDIKYE